MNTEEGIATTNELSHFAGDHNRWFVSHGAGEMAGTLIAVAVLELPPELDVREVVSQRIRALVQECRKHATTCREC